MLVGKIILAVSSLAFVGFGLVSLVSPEVPADLIGFTLDSGDTYAEVSAVYGGLQTALGLFLLIALIKASYYRAGLLVLFLCMGCLALARLAGLTMTADSATSYSAMALGFETIVALIAAFAYRKNTNDPT